MGSLKQYQLTLSSELVQQSNEINVGLDKCSQPAFKQPLPTKQLLLMTDASFTAAGYATLTEGDPNLKVFQKILRFFCIWIMYSITTQDFHKREGIFSPILRLQRVSTKVLGKPQPITIFTDKSLVTRFFQTKALPALWNACDYVVNFNCIVTQHLGKKVYSKLTAVQGNGP